MIVARNISAVLIAMCVACNLDSTAIPRVQNLDTAYWDLSLNHHAIILATSSPYDTVQLIAIPRNISGDVIQVNQSPIFRIIAGDTSVKMRSDGFIKAHSPRASVRVVAELTINGVTLADTAIVTVRRTTGGVPILSQFSIQPIGDDSTKVDASGRNPKVLSVFVKDQNGKNIATAPIYFRSADRTIVSIDSIATVTARVDDIVSAAPKLVGVKPGKAYLYAETFAYGVAMRDSVLFVVGYPLFRHEQVWTRNVPGQAEAVSGFLYGRVVIGEGGIVNWTTNSISSLFGTPGPFIDVMFSTSSGVLSAPGIDIWGFPCPETGGGNIALFRYESEETKPYPPDSAHISILCRGSRARKFSIAGEYKYQSSSGAKGVIVVKKDSF